MPLPSLNVVTIDNVFVIVVLADNAVERSVVAFSFTSIAVAITRLPLRRTYSPIDMESTDFADVPAPNLGACCNVSKGWQSFLTL
jgi:hypothetical protein